MHIILIILRIVGIMLASILGVVLLFIGLTLFVPIRYRAKAEKNEKISFRFIGSWLLHALHISVRYDGETPVVKLRIIGIPIFDSTKEKKEIDSKKKDKKQKETKTEQKVQTEELVHTMELSQGNQATHENQVAQGNQATNETDDLTREHNILPGKRAFHESKYSNEVTWEKGSSKNSSSKNDSNKVNLEKTFSKDNSTSTVEQNSDSNDFSKLEGQNKDSLKEEQSSNKISSSQSEIQNEENKQEQEKEIRIKTEKNEDDKKNESFSKKEKIVAIIQTIIAKFTSAIQQGGALLEKGKQLFGKVKEIFSQTKSKIQEIRSTCHTIWNKIIMVKDFIQHEDNKKGFSSIFGSIIQILKKLGPNKIKGNIRFGTGDPCSTGQALGVLGICYGWIGNGVKITPDFENEVLEGELFIKGRFRIISLLIIGIKLLKDDGFNKLRTNFAKLKEDI